MAFWQTVKADLRANTGYEGAGKFVSALLFNPGFSTIFLHRVAVHLYRKRYLRRLGIVVWRWNLATSGCHIHLEPDIAPGLFLPHPIAVVIGEDAKIGSWTAIYQGVTIGKTASPIYPSIGEYVTLFPNVVIIGPISIGDGAVIGASSVVLKDVPERGVVAGNPARLLRVGEAVCDPTVASHIAAFG